MDTYPRCETCNHWEPYTGNSFGKCALISSGRDGRATVETDKFAHGVLYLEVKPTFGCVLHEPKE